ncbi:MAG: glycosyltransferase family A protein [Planctomycetota bacterium]|nr:glycosyltransferase family A protein [Planctomycetota bacterium]MDA1212859.1 glycosyltransferase family A protein [Planctomycetota bacterium]
MNIPTISVITPTLGRDSLTRTMISVVPQLGPNDEWLIVADGACPAARELVERASDTRIRYFESLDNRSAYGNAQRNAAMRQSKNDLLMFVDDDDWLLPDALDAVRREGVHGVPLMFRMDYLPRNTLLWRVSRLREANVGGGMFVTPNRRDRLAEWPVYDDSYSDDYRASDYQFISRTLALWPANSLRWCRDVIYCCPQHGRGQ